MIYNYKKYGVLKMTKSEFSNNLKNVNLSKKDFAKMTGVSYNTINNWNDSDRMPPLWVESWLENYKLACRYKLFEKILKGEINKSL